METAPVEEPRSSRWSTWTRRFDPVGLGCFLVAVVVYSIQGFLGPLARDSGLYVYAGQRVAEGSLPYVDVANRAGPLAHAIPGLGVIGARIVGIGDVQGVRVLFMLLSALSVAAVYLLGRDLSRTRLVGVLSAACLLTFQGFSHYATFGPREKTAMVLFATMALIAVSRQRWLAAGVWIALATLTWQPVLVALLAATGAAIVISVPVRRWWRAVLGVAAGGVIPAGITLGVYAVAGSLGVFIDYFLLINARYTDQDSPLERLGPSWRLMVDGYGWSVWLFMGGLLGAVFLALLAVVRPGVGSRAERGGALALGVYAIGATAWTLNAFQSWPDTMVLMPAAAVGAGGLVGLLLRRLPTNAALGVTAALTAVSVAAAVGYSLNQRSTVLHRQQDFARAVVDAVPGATILAVEAPQPLVLTRSENISRFHIYSGGMLRYVSDQYPDGTQGYVQWLQGQHPTLIAMGRKTEKNHKWAKPLLEGYEQVGQNPYWSWWVAESVPQGQRDAIVAAIAAAKDQ